MTITTTINRRTYNGAGIVGPFAVDFKFLLNADIKVSKTLIATGVATVLAEGADYVLTGAGTDAGGSLTLTVALDPTYRLTIYRDPVQDQQTKFPPNDKFPAAANENAVDKLTMLCQRFLDVFARTARLKDTDVSNADVTLPTPVAGNVIGWKADLTGLQNYILAGILAVSAYGQTLLNAIDAAAARAVLLASAGGDTIFTAATAYGATIVTAANAAASRVALLIDGTSRVLKAGDMASSMMGFSLINGTLVPSQNGTQLTVAIKTLAGADPSAADPVYVLFRNVTPGTGDYTVITLTAATSIQTTVAGTFGVANAVPFRLWVVGFNDGGVFRLALINCLTTVVGAGAGRDVTAIFALSGWGIASATQIGAGSTSAGVFYSAGAAVAAKAYTTLGYLTYEAGLAAAGTFGINQSRTELFSQNDPLPGQVIQVQRNDTGALATGTTLIPFDDTIPQSTEGDQYLAQAITPSSAANVLAVEAQIDISNNNASGMLCAAALLQDATANALKATCEHAAGSTNMLVLQLEHKSIAASTAAITFKVRAGSNVAGTTTFNGQAGVREFGGVMNSYLECSEIMA